MAKEATHSARFETVKRYYDRGLWSAERVAQAVVHAWITADEYAEIVGEPYDDEAV